MMSPQEQSSIFSGVPGFKGTQSQSFVPKGKAKWQLPESSCPRCPAALCGVGPSGTQTSLLRGRGRSLLFARLLEGAPSPPATPCFLSGNSAIWWPSLHIPPVPFLVRKEHLRTQDSGTE